MSKVLPPSWDGAERRTGRTTGFFHINGDPSPEAPVAHVSDSEAYRIEMLRRTGYICDRLNWLCNVIGYVIGIAKWIRGALFALLSMLAPPALKFLSELLTEWLKK